MRDGLFGRVCKAGRGGRQAARCDHDAALACEVQNLLVDLRRKAIDTGQDQDLVGNANRGDGIGIDEIEIEARIENLGDDVGLQEAGQRFVDGDVGARLIETERRSRRPFFWMPATNEAQTSSLGSSRATSFAGLPWRIA